MLESLAETIIGSMLAPLLKKGGEKALEACGEALGKDAGEFASRIPLEAWRLLSTAFTSENELTTLKLFESSPGDNQAKVKEILTGKVEQDTALRESLRELARAWEGRPANHSVKIKIRKAKVISSTIIGQINNSGRSH